MENIENKTKQVLENDKENEEEMKVESHNDEGNMGVRVYNLFIVVADIIMLIIKWWYFTFESLYKLFVPPEEISVKGEIVFITGTGHGIGKELAIQYAQLGATVIGVDINEKGNNETIKEVKAQGGKAFGYVCDVSKRESIIEVANKVKSEVGKVTIIVNNAGIMPTHPLLQHTEGEIRKIFDINVLAHFWILQEFAPDMIEMNKGHVVALSSMAGLMGLNNLVPYCGSKFAVRGIMEAFGQELRQDPRNPDIKFTSIYPYMVDTGLCKKPHVRFQSLMNLVKPSEAAAAIISAQRRGLEEASIPRYLYFLNLYTRLFPTKSANLLRDFLDSGVESDL